MFLVNKGKWKRLMYENSKEWYRMLNEDGVNFEEYVLF